MFDKKNFPLALVMIQPSAMPGSYLNAGESFEEITQGVLKEAEMIVQMGFDGFILQNMHDGPIAQQARPETIAYMTYLSAKLKDRYPDKVLGILVNWDGVASLAVAAATKADFVRVEHLYTGVSIDLGGFMFDPVKNLFIVDAGITGERLIASRTKTEFAETAIKEGSLLFFLYVAGRYVQQGIEKISEKFGKPIELHAEVLSSGYMKDAISTGKAAEDVKTVLG